MSKCQSHNSIKMKPSTGPGRDCISYETEAMKSERYEPLPQVKTELQYSEDGFFEIKEEPFDFYEIPPNVFPSMDGTLQDVKEESRNSDYYISIKEEPFDATIEGESSELIKRDGNAADIHPIEGRSLPRVKTEPQDSQHGSLKIKEHREVHPSDSSYSKGETLRDIKEEIGRSGVNDISIKDEPFDFCVGGQSLKLIKSDGDATKNYRFHNMSLPRVKMEMQDLQSESLKITERRLHENELPLSKEEIGMSVDDEISTKEEPLDAHVEGESVKSVQGLEDATSARHIDNISLPRLKTEMQHESLKVTEQQFDANEVHPSDAFSPEDESFRDLEEEIKKLEEDFITIKEELLDVGVEVGTHGRINSSIMGKENAASVSSNTDFMKGRKPHTEEKLNSGNVRSESYLESNNRKKHSKAMEPEEQISNPTSIVQKTLQYSQRPFECKVCGKRFGHKSHLTSHTRIHTGQTPYACTECVKTFKYSYSLIVHRRIHTGEKPYKCQKCEKKFTCSSSLISHQRVHTGNRPHECKECGKRLTSKTVLRMHQRIHSGEKPHHCEECDKKFRTKQALMHHQKIHAGDKRFECNECGGKYTYKSQLISHIRVHSSERHFKCKDCGKTFRSNSHFLKHKRRYHVDSTGKL